jgi:hypothetical protein
MAVSVATLEKVLCPSLVAIQESARSIQLEMIAFKPNMCTLLINTALSIQQYQYSIFNRRERVYIVCTSVILVTTDLALQYTHIYTRILILRVHVCCYSTCCTGAFTRTIAHTVAALQHLQTNRMNIYRLY